MSRKHKNRHKFKQGERVICPSCFDENAADRIEMIVKKNITKSTSYPLMRKNGRLEIDYGIILQTDTQSQEFILICPKCNTEEVYTSPELLFAEIGPLVEYIAQLGAFKDTVFDHTPPKQKGKEKHSREESLPKIVRISENDTTYKH